MNIAGRAIGEDAPPYVIAEAGVHHGNSVELAKEYIRQAAVAGADAVKFQTYRADSLVTRWARTYWSEPEAATQHEIFARRALLAPSDYAMLIAYGQEMGIHVLSTPFDEEAVDMLVDAGMEAIKIASADLTNLPLLRRAHATGLPMILSTGAATMDEVAATLRHLEGADISLLHCNLAYPTPVAQANLGRIHLLARRFPQTIIGYSDHTRAQETELTCPLAVGLGARVVEKHFTLNRLLEGDDHGHAVDTAGLARLVRGCRDAWRMTRHATEQTESEAAAREHARRSLVAARDLEAGTRLGPEDVLAKRPGTGVSPMRIDDVVGRILAVDKSVDELFFDTDLQ